MIVIEITKKIKMTAVIGGFGPPFFGRNRYQRAYDILKIIK